MVSSDDPNLVEKPTGPAAVVAPKKRGRMLTSAERSAGLRAMHDARQLAELTQGVKPPPSLTDIPPPALGDKLGAAAYAHDVAVVLLQQAIADPNLSDAQRRDAVLKATQTIAQLKDAAAIKAAADAIANEKKMLDSPTQGPKMEPAVNASPADSSPSSAKTLRAAPRRRGIG